MPVQTSEQTIAAALARSATVDGAIESIIAELREAQASITEARPPRPGLKADLNDRLARLEATKGRPAYYPYVGSGIGNGPLVELADGSVKWDMINGIGVHMFGHSDPDLVAIALRAALADTVMQGNLQFNAETVAFSEFILGEAAKCSNLKYAFLTNSGAMANESALKVCMQKKDGRAPRAIAFADCFAGRSYAMTQISDNAEHRLGLPITMTVDYISFYDPADGERSIAAACAQLRDLIERYPGQHACFSMELVQGEGGFNIAPREFFIALMEVCREHDIPIWVDEVQTFGRTTQMFYFDALELGEYVDVVTIGKMSQICACLYTEAMNPKPGLLSGTFIGTTVALQVGRATLERLRAGDYYGSNGRIAKLQQTFRAKMQRLVEKHPESFPQVNVSRAGGGGAQRIPPGVFGGVGGMMRFTPFAGEKKKIVEACKALFDEGVITFYCGHGPYHIRFLPPVGVMEPQQFDPVFEIVERALARVAQ